MSDNFPILKKAIIHVKNCSRLDCVDCTCIRTRVWILTNPVCAMLIDLDDSKFKVLNHIRKRVDQNFIQQIFCNSSDKQIISNILIENEIPSLLIRESQNIPEKKSLASLAYNLHINGKSNSVSRHILSSTYWFNYKSVFSNDYAKYLHEILKIGYRLSEFYGMSLFDTWKHTIMQYIVVNCMY